MLTIEYKDETMGEWVSTGHRYRTRRGADGFIAKRRQPRLWRAVGDPEPRRQRTQPAPEGWVKVGDVFRASWGYDMSINDFFEVVAVSKTGRTCTLRELRKLCDGDPWSPEGCHVRPMLTGDDRFAKGDMLGRKRVGMFPGRDGRPGSCYVRLDSCRTGFLMEPEDYVRGFHECHWD